jgi:hypothetical protein
VKRLLLALVFLVMIAAAPTQNAEAAAPLMRTAVQSCAFGAGTFAAATYLGLVPALSTGTLTLPVTGAIAANALIGCGVGVAGAVSSTVIGWVYDTIF